MDGTRALCLLTSISHAMLYLWILALWKKGRLCWNCGLPANTAIHCCHL